jgi:TRAP-type C4-dicarboxylate transport system permease large subunit
MSCGWPFVGGAIVGFIFGAVCMVLAFVIADRDGWQ